MFSFRFSTGPVTTWTVKEGAPGVGLEIKNDTNAKPCPYCISLNQSGNNKIAVIALCPYALL